MVGATAILGPDGIPIREIPGLAEPGTNGRSSELSPEAARRKLFQSSTVVSYLQALANSRLPAIQRAEDPLSNHAWVLSSALIVSTTAAQAPLVVMRETGKQVERRRSKAHERGKKWDGPFAGSRRRAFHRHLRVPLMKRLSMNDSTAESDLEHPLTELLVRPNPLQNGDQLIQVTLLFLRVRGECFWVKGDAEGNPTTGGPGELPEQLWPLSPDLFVERLRDGATGPLVGWWYSPPRWMSGARGRIPLTLDQVVQFKLPNPGNPLRGLSRLSAVAQGIQIDLATNAYTANLLNNRAVPKGTLKFEGALTPKEQEEFRAAWEQMHKGVENAERVGILHSGFEWQSIAMSPADMEFLQQRTWDREEILAVLGTPPSLLGLTQFTNYATALSQDKSFWDKTILPDFRLIEAEIDSTLLFPETDDIFCMFDVRGIEALRAGISDKADIVTKLTAAGIHMPPKQALEAVDLPAEDYPGNEDALVPSTLVPVRLAVDDEFQGVGLPANPGLGAPSPAAEGTPLEPGGAAVGAPPAKGSAALLRSAGARTRAAGKRWRDFLKIETKLEKPAMGAYRAWVAARRRDVLRAFDEVAAGEGKARAKTLDLTAVLPELADLESTLKTLLRPTYAGVLEAAWDFTLDDIGVPVFAIDDAAILSYFDLRERKIISESAKTLLGRVKASLAQGVSAGDTVAQLRARIGHVFDVSQSAAKTLTWARTEVSGLFNGVRDQMFRAQGIEEQDWTTAGDEVVRPDHQVFGQQGSQKLDHNYLSDVGRSDGQLRHPGDVEAPVDQIINCRCVAVPA